MSWLNRYKPKTSEDIIGQDHVIEKVRDYLKNYSAHKGKALLLCGPPGCGKTSTIYAMANDMDLEIFEVNSSDVRNKGSIEDVVGSASTQMSLFGRKKVILLDEIDGLSGTKDRGGASAAVKVIENSAFPVIMTANDAFSDKLKAVRKVSTVVELSPVNYVTIKKLFQKILDNEGVEYEESALSDLARRSGGDLRGAINDLESLAIINKKITNDTIHSVDQRDKQDTIENALLKVFKTKDIKIAISSFNKIPQDLNETFLWVEYNMPREYTDTDDLYRGIEALSRSDIFKRRIMRRQDWRYLVYCNFFQTVGVSLAKKEKYKKIIEYKRTSKLLKIWSANMSTAKRKAFASRMREYFHTSSRVMNLQITPYFKYLYNNDKEFAEASHEQYELADDEVKFLKK